LIKIQALALTPI